jgi:hypothetical protein
MNDTVLLVFVVRLRIVPDLAKSDLESPGVTGMGFEIARSLKKRGIEQRLA